MPLGVCAGSRKGGHEGGSGLRAGSGPGPAPLWAPGRLGESASWNPESHESVGPGPLAGAGASGAEFFRVELRSSGESGQTCADLSCLRLRPSPDAPVAKPSRSQRAGGLVGQPAAFTPGHRAGWGTVGSESGEVEGAPHAETRAFPGRPCIRPLMLPNKSPHLEACGVESPTPGHPGLMSVLWICRVTSCTGLRGDVTGLLGDMFPLLVVLSVLPY